MYTAKDILTRIAELAGVQVAEQIVNEFGGQQVYVRKTVERARTTVRCVDCTHVQIKDRGPGYTPESRCGINNLHTSLVHWRACKDFRVRSDEIEAIARHFGLPVQEVYRIAADHKSTRPSQTT